MDHALIVFANLYFTLAWLYGVSAFVHQCNQAFAFFDRRVPVPLVPVAAEASEWTTPLEVSAWGQKYLRPLPASDYAAYSSDLEGLSPPLCRLVYRLRIDPARLGRFACD